MPGRRDPWLTPYMIPLGRKAASRQYRRVVGVSASQSGKTDTILDVMGARLDQRPAPILYLGPGKEFNTEQFEPRLMQLIDEAESLARKVLRGKRMKKTLKWIAGVRVRLAHAGSSAAIKSDPFALALVDEVDEMMSNIRGQGDPVGLAEARGETYSDFVLVIVGTTSHGIVETEIDPVNGLELFKVADREQVRSPVWRHWQEGTRHHWAWPCPHCGTYFVPYRKHLHWPKGATPAQAAREAYLLCPAADCGGVIEEQHKPEMNARGVMVAPGQTIEDAQADRNHPDNVVWSQWASGLASPFVTFGLRASRLLSVMMTGDEDKIQTAVNSNFAEPYAPGATGDLPEWKELLEHRVGYPVRSLPRQVLRLGMGIDVQKRGLYYVIRGFGSRGTSYLIDNGFLHGLTDEDAVWEDLANLILSPIRGMHVERAIIDSGFRPDKPGAGSEHRVYGFARRFSWVVSAAKGRDTLGARPYTVSEIEVKADGRKRLYSLELVHVNSDFFKSLVHSRVKTPLDKLGAFYLHDDADEEYARQVLSEVRTVQPGDPKPKWQKTQRDNHFLDCEALAAVAGYVMNVQAIPEGIEREWATDEQAEAETAPAEDETDLPPEEVEQRAAEQVQTDLRSRFRSLGARMR